MTQPSLKIVEYIKQRGLEKLCETYNITAKRHGKYNNLVQLKYDQIESDPKEEIVRQARGIILDENNDWRVVCWGYNRFSNYGEGWGAEIDWNTARVAEKLDGSICYLYRFNNEWIVASSSLPDANGNVNGFDYTFASLFWEVWNKLNYRLPREDNLCFSFELMTAYNRIIVKHENQRIVLHGARNLSNLWELNPVPVAYENGWECVKFFPLTSIEEVVGKANELDPLKQEGFVVVDKNFNRLKVKSDQYVALSHLKDSVVKSERQLLEIVRKNESEEFLIHFPELLEPFYKVKVKYENLVGKMEGSWEMIKDLEVGKSFALKAKNVSYSDGLFQRKYGRVDSFKHYLANIPIKSLEKMLDIKIEE